MNLTTQQQRVFDFIVSFRADNGISPTLIEIASHFDCSKVTIHNHVDILISKGALTRDPHKSRSLLPDGRHLPANEAWRAGVADIASRLNSIYLRTQDDFLKRDIANIRRDLVALLARGGAK